MAVLAPTSALADEEAPADDVDTSDTTVGTPEPPEGPAPLEAEEGFLEESPSVADVTPDVEDAPAPQAEDELVREDVDPTARSEVAAAEELILPALGFGKTSQPVRVGVDLERGTYVPAGVTTAGSRLRITESGPDVEGGTRTTDCTTDASTAEGTATFCILDQPDPPEASAVIVGFPGLPPVLGGLSSQARGALQPGHRDPAVGRLRLVADPESAVVPACGSSQVGVSSVGDLPGFGPSIFPIDVDEEFIDFVRQILVETVTNPWTRQVALLEDTGLPPVAADDSATTREDTPVTIDVLANDDTVAGAPMTGLDFGAAPSNGSVEIVGSEDAPRVQYTPDAGFSGSDTFGYRISTPNGTAFAEVTVVVEPDAALAATSGVSPATVSGLPNAGGPALSMLGWASLLVAAGAAVLAGERRRRTLR